MDQINNSSNDFIVIGDEQILSLSKDIFKVSRFKELLIREDREKLLIHLNHDQQQNKLSILQLFKQAKVAEELIDVNKIEFEFSQDCQLLNIATHSWQKGKITVKVCIGVTSKNMDRVYIEFYPHETANKSSLENSKNGHSLMVSSTYN